MIIDVKNEKIILKDFHSQLKPYQISQLDYWGFSFEGANNLKLSTLSYDKTLLKIVRFFDKEKVPYELSRTCKQIVDKINNERVDFESYLTKAIDYKDGNIDSKELGEFISFINKNIPRKLKDHQIKAALHLHYIKNGANFSVPGSGKTSVVLTVFEKLRLEGKVNVLFVVGPLSSFGPWKNEFKETLGREPECYTFAGDFKINREIEYYKTQAFRELYLITYQTLLNDVNDAIEFLSNKKLKVFLVIDEAHYIKQINGNWANAVIKCAEHALYRCILTGTPIPKSYEDLYNLVEFLWPGKNLLSTEEKYQLQKYELKKENEKAQEILDKRVGPIFYRVRKKDLELKNQNFLPPKKIKMNEYERKVYDAIYFKLKKAAKDEYLKNIDIVDELIKGRMIRLRQATSYTKLLSNAIFGYNEKLFYDNEDLGYIIYKYDKLELPAKLEYLTNFIIKLQKKRKKIIIWSNFIGTIKMLEKHLNKIGVYNKIIIGETPVEKENLISKEETRDKIRNEFIDTQSGLDVLIANPAACSESISLHKSCYDAVYYDLSYNCAQYLQSLDRIHRVGGSEYHEANYYFLHYKNTIDSDILDNLNKKAQRMYNIIEGDYNIYTLDMFDEQDEIQAYKRLFSSK